MKWGLQLILGIVLAAQLVPVLGADAYSNTVGLSVSLVNQDPDPALAGNIVEVRLGVVNLGGRAASDVMLELVPSYPFSLLPGESAVQGVGTISGYQGQYDNNQKIVKYQLQVDKNAVAGNYTFKVRTYDDGSKETLSQNTLSLDVTSKAHAEVASIGNSVLVPGEQSRLKFTITNVGNVPLRSLTFNWENADKVILPVGSDNARYVSYIDVGGSSELDYEVIADTNANPGLYKLDLQLSYTDPATGSETKVTTVAGVYVGGGTDFDVAFSDSSGSQTSFTIANIGSNPATSVSISIPEQRGWAVSGASSFIIGNLNKGDYTVASFGLQSPGQMLQNRTAARPRGMQNFSGMPAVNSTPDTVRLQIAYTDTMGARKVVEKEVKVGAQGASSIAGMAGMQARMNGQSQSVLVQYQWYIIGIAGIAILLVAYRRYESRRMLKAGSDHGRGLPDRKR